MLRMRKIRTGRKEKRDVETVKLRSEENKWKIMERKGRVRGTEIWIEEDKTFRERKIEKAKKLRRITEEEGNKGRR